MQTSDPSVSGLEDFFGGAQGSGMRTINGEVRWRWQQRAESRTWYFKNPPERCVCLIRNLRSLKNQGRKVIRTQACVYLCPILATFFCRNGARPPGYATPISRLQFPALCRTEYMVDGTSWLPSKNDFVQRASFDRICRMTDHSNYGTNLRMNVRDSFPAQWWVWEGRSPLNS